MFILSTKLKIKIAQILSKIIRCGYMLLGKKSDHVIVTRHGVQFDLDLKEGIDLAIYLGVYETTTLRAFRTLVKPGDVVLDIGANIGAHTLDLAKLVGNTGKVYAFEPTSYAFSKLNRNIFLNPTLSHSIIAEQLMLSDSDTQTPETAIYSSWPLAETGSLHSKHLGNLKSTEGCSAIRLDSYFSKKQISTLQFIKIDVDGFEYQVFKGAVKILEAFKPIILMEFAPYLLEERGDTLEALATLLKNIGYRFYHLNTNTEFLIQPGQIFPSGKSVNVIARVS